MARTQYEGDWSKDVHDALDGSGVTQIGYVPDGGMKNVINYCIDNPKMSAIPLASEEEGPCLAAGAWLGGGKAAIIMQSTGIGNAINTFSMIEVCQFPCLVLVSHRSSWGEGNRWQTPMGQRGPDYFKMAGFHTHFVEHGIDAGETVAAAAAQAYNTGNGIGVFFSQRVMGVKKFL
ncbi:MAG: thiamine pyrophosphate-binding protein [Roseovarius sp.]|nr:thiamine pyrophosphate-binding protein [Roseovarius sp.]MCY4207173.1 thiamine pyrophosphate-binding protein [Roseovarius sp.]MCY4291129.1 thiamine pyrophosphate-binding protein [Roseovarius sp.]MCY4315040.1 thiamine pyrophosphate-binding protein [Roseovarius sp.]